MTHLEKFNILDTKVKRLEKIRSELVAEIHKTVLKHFEEVSGIYVGKIVQYKGKKGVITKDMGNYIGVNFYEKLTTEPLPCHPTWNVEYLETFNHIPPIKKQTASQRRYKAFLEADNVQTFAEFIGVR